MAENLRVSRIPLLIFFTKKYKSASDNSASQHFLGKFCLFFAKFRKKNCEIWLKIDEIWPNSASQKIPGLLTYTYMTVIENKFFSRN